MTLTITVDGIGEALAAADRQRIVEQAIAAARDRSRQLQGDSAEPARSTGTPPPSQLDQNRR